MLPVIALVGRPNVGKSTLFNQLTRSRDALVADEPGVTRDRRYGLARGANGPFIVIDTGGVVGEAPTGIEALVARQVDYAVAEADSVVFIVDRKQGLTAEDERIAGELRRAGKPIAVAVNKSEGVAPDIAEAEFHGLGLGAPIAIAALRSQGLDRLLERVLAPFPLDAEAAAGDGGKPRISVIGRPNVGKSTLINRLVGEDRLVTSPEPGTTRDSVRVPCARDGQEFVLVDTAGVRRRARAATAIEKFSVVQTLAAIEGSGAVIVLLDAREGVSDQDLHVIGLTAERGRALVIGVNKWDGLAQDARRAVEREVERRLDFVPYARVCFLSALHGSGISELVRAALSAFESAGRDLPTPRLNAVLAAALEAHQPPLVGGRRPRLRYAHQGGRFPPLIVVHGGQAEPPAHYRRYLENAFRGALRLEGTPVRVEFRSGDNPYAGRRKPLMPREAKRRRVGRRERGRGR